MRSFQIMQRFNESNNTHANNNNATLDRLRAQLEARLVQNVSLPLNATMTGPDGEVYQSASNRADELALLMFNLSNANMTAGGDCLEPSINLFNRSDCLDHNSTDPQTYGVELVLNACHTNTTTNLNASTVLGLFTAFCAIAPDSHDDDGSDVYFYVILSVSALLLVILAGMCIAHNCTSDQENTNRSLFLSRRRSNNNQERASILGSIDEEYDDSPVLYGSDDEELYSQQPTGPGSGHNYSRANL